MIYLFNNFIIHDSQKVWIGGGAVPPDKHKKDVPFLDKYAMERWEVIHKLLKWIIFLRMHQLVIELLIIEWFPQTCKSPLIIRYSP